MSCSMVHREHDCLLSVDKEPANTKEGQRVPVVLYYSTSPVLVLATAYGITYLSSSTGLLFVFDQ